MALILAIESDKKQAARLEMIARDPLHAELVIGESTEQAFTLLGKRHPDLILTSLLLSSKDEAALADRMHELDAAGWRVQTLVIPVFGGHKGRSSESGGGGLLTRLRGGKASRESSRGCDPSVFAAQVAEYLERAATERAVALEDAEAAAAAAAAHAARAALAAETAATPAAGEEAEFEASFDEPEASPAPVEDVQLVAIAPDVADTYVSVVTKAEADVDVPQAADVEPEAVVAETSAAGDDVVVGRVFRPGDSSAPQSAYIEPEPVFIKTKPAADAHVVPFDILDDLDNLPDPVLVVEPVDDGVEYEAAALEARADNDEESVEIPLDEITETPAQAPEPPPTAILLEEPEIELPEIEIITTAPFDANETAAVVYEETPRVEQQAAAVLVETPVPPQNGWHAVADEDVPTQSIAADEKHDEAVDSDSVIQAEPIDLAFMAELVAFDPPAPAREPVRIPDATPVVFPDPPPVVAAKPAAVRGDSGPMGHSEAERDSASAEGRGRSVTERAGVGPREKGKEGLPKPTVAASSKSHKKANKKTVVPSPAMPPLAPAPKRPALVAQPPDALRLVWAWPRLEGAGSEADFKDFVTDQPADDRVAQLAPPAETRGGRSKNKRAQEPQHGSKKKQKSAPPQDEWGFFDPEQCGFAALVAKLDELALDELGKDESTPARRK